MSCRSSPIMASSCSWVERAASSSVSWVASTLDSNSEVSARMGNSRSRMDEQNMESHCRAKISPDFKRRSLDIENIIRPSLKAFEIRLGCYFEKGFRAIRARDGRRYSAEQRADGIDCLGGRRQAR